MKQSKLKYDYRELDSFITKEFGSHSNFCKAMPISERALSLKFKNERPWTQPQIERAVELLNIPETRVFPVFFTKKVQNH